VDRLSLLLHSRRWLLLGALALVSLALGSALFSGATFSSKSASSASLAAASVQLSSSSPNQAIVAAAGMRPGEDRQGTIAVGNDGTAPASVTLRASGLTGVALAAAIDLELEEANGGGWTQRWSGKLGSFHSVALGSLAPGASRNYRFTLSWPPSADEASLQGASTALAFQWSGSS
jgi:hypothetical protein